VNNTRSFDTDLHMFRQTTTLNLAHLYFLRWLAEQGRLEHPPAGPSSGPLVDEMLLLGVSSPIAAAAAPSGKAC
jgi:hypothetical protein